MGRPSHPDDPLMAPPRETPEQSTPQVADGQCHQTVTERQPPLAGVEHKPGLPEPVPALVAAGTLFDS
jgi:hypothetical protein